jgi:ribosomal protein L13E
VYAELGGTWFVLMQKPLEAAHVLGKLLAAFGPERILWGTDALFLGTPQAQIAAFRAFQIPTELQERHGYPALTADVKRKILGLNAARLLGIDPEARRYQVTDAAFEAELRARREQSHTHPPPLPSVYGPRTRRELFAYLSRRGRP